MIEYSNQTRMLVSVDCVVIGFDGEDYKLLLIQRGFEPEKDKWSLMGGFLQPSESLDEAAQRILFELTGLRNVYMEQLHAFSHPNRDPVERVIGMTYFALIDIKQYAKQLCDHFQPNWFKMKSLPALIFDHQNMVDLTLKQLRYKAALHPILFELLPKKFTLPQLQILYEGLYDIPIDKRNFSRKVLSTGIISRKQEKDKSKSKKGAYFYTLNQESYHAQFQRVLNFIPKNEIPPSVESDQKDRAVLLEG
ncbi:putative Nudix-like regulator [Lunatimonas lonarensis]|uniref:Putative Nudix-like regulator n=1 Tax=Lunatimonas lonarensis TaxID=1232681 RepID=R7ZVE4_9BACT|nr:NUDIX domain-containing protein [Lunatimonas lonarensis]EON77989.1 putative Nudix-like regulator [Lunatimonas lonarensis]